MLTEARQIEEGKRAQRPIFRSIARHKPHDHGPNDRYRNGVSTKMISDGRGKRSAESLLVEDICKEAN